MALSNILPYRFQLSGSNTLSGVNIFSIKYGNQEATTDLGPSSSIKRGYVMQQFWDLEKDKDAKIFVMCIYKNFATITHELDQAIDTCRYTSAMQLAGSPSLPFQESFHCYKKNKIDTLVGKFCESF
jgi:hypothetical protein